MTIEDAQKIKAIAEYEIGKILRQLMDDTGCSVKGVSVVTEEGYGIISEIITSVEINLQIK